MSINVAVDKYIKEKVNEVLTNEQQIDIEYVETDNFGELLEKLVILHIRTWMLEDAIQAARTDAEIAELKRKIDICFKQKRPKLVQALNILIDNAILHNKSLREDSVKIYRGISELIKNIAFYNHYHNGDVFATKAYVKEITDAFPDLKFFYMHRNSNKLLADLPIEIFNINYFPSLYDRTKIIVGEVDNTIYINTWIRNILESGTGVNWETYHLMFKEFYSFLNEYFGSNLILKDKNFYIPEIDFSFFDIPNDFVCDYENTIIFSERCSSFRAI
jgi:hypothetical protein